MYTIKCCRKMDVKYEVLHTLHPALEDGTDRGFRNVGKPQSEAGEIPKRIHTRLIFFCLPVHSYFNYYYMLWKTNTNSNQIQAYTTQVQGAYMTYMCQALISVAKRSLLYRTEVISILPPIT